MPEAGRRLLAWALRRARTLRVRLTLAFASVVAIVLAVTGAFVLLQFSRDLTGRTDDDLTDRQVVMVGLSRASAPQRVIELSGEPYSAIYGASGAAPIAESRGARGHALLTAVQVAAARREARFFDGSYPGGDGDGSRLRAFPIAGGRVAVIAEPLDDRELAIHRLELLLGITLPAALLLASVAGYQVARGALIPVERMRRRAAELGAGDADGRLPEPDTGDELQRLATTLNDLLDRLHGAVERERRIVGDASHELRTPIAVLKTRVDVALRGEAGRDPEALRAALTEVGADAARLARLADDLLVLARADQGQLPLRPDPLDVQDILEGAARRNAAAVDQAGRAIEVAVAIEGGAVVLADPDRTAQALDNLIANALRYGDGIVELGARLTDGGGQVALTVRDHGAGFPEEFLPGAFERFTQADPGHGGAGSGLGLAIVDALARAQGGTATAANAEGGGAVVSLTLDVA